MSARWRRRRPGARRLRRRRRAAGAHRPSPASTTTAARSWRACPRPASRERTTDPNALKSVYVTERAPEEGRRYFAPGLAGLRRALPGRAEAGRAGPAGLPAAGSLRAAGEVLMATPPTARPATISTARPRGPDAVDDRPVLPRARPEHAARHRRRARDANCSAMTSRCGRPRRARRDDAAAPRRRSRRAPDQPLGRAPQELRTASSAPAAARCGWPALPTARPPPPLSPAPPARARRDGDDLVI